METTKDIRKRTNEKSFSLIAYPSTDTLTEGKTVLEWKEERPMFSQQGRKDRTQLSIYGYEKELVTITLPGLK